MVALKAAFDDPDARATVESKLLALKQHTKDCSSYHAEFVTYAASLQLDDQTKILFFRRGLAKQVQTALANQQIPPTTFAEFVQLCITLDNNLRALEVIFPGTAPRTLATSTATGTQARPMDLSATQHTSRRRGPISDDQCKYRRENNLCMYCGQLGHWATNYLVKKKNL